MGCNQIKARPRDSNHDSNNNLDHDSNNGPEHNNKLKEQIVPSDDTAPGEPIWEPCDPDAPEEDGWEYEYYYPEDAEADGQADEADDNSQADDSHADDSSNSFELNVQNNIVLNDCNKHIVKEEGVADVQECDFATPQKTTDIPAEPTVSSKTLRNRRRRARRKAMKRRKRKDYSMADDKRTLLRALEEERERAAKLQDRVQWLEKVKIGE